MMVLADAEKMLPEMIIGLLVLPIILGFLVRGVLLSNCPVKASIGYAVGAFIGSWIFLEVILDSISRRSEAIEKLLQAAVVLSITGSSVIVVFALSAFRQKMIDAERKKREPVKKLWNDDDSEDSPPVPPPTG